jgi:hypothetical protein
MNTECSAERINFHGLGGRGVVGRFDGGRISSDGGCVLLREVEERTHLLKRLAGCFVDHRDPELIEHSVGSLVKQRVYGIALGYEDLNDHDTLRYDALLGLLADKEDPSGAGRRRTEDRGKALAGKSTLNRLELTPKEAGKEDRYKKIVAQTEAMDTLLVEVFIESHAVPPKEIVIDVDATDDPLHGDQEGRFFHGYYGHYCYLPLYFFCGDRLLCARLREADEEPASGCVEELSRIVAQVRAAWPEGRIVLRGDSGFCREGIMSWCETHGVEYGLGLAKNSRLTAIIAGELAKARGAYEASGEAARWFKDFRYKTRESWTCERRVVGKAEYLAKGENPRHLARSGGLGGASLVRRSVLCPWGDGKPDQGTAAPALRRSHEHPRNRLESIAAVFLLLRLCAHRDPASAGAFRNRAGASAMRHDPPETLQDRSPGSTQCAQDLDRLLRGISLCASLPGRA